MSAHCGAQCLPQATTLFGNVVVNMSLPEEHNTAIISNGLHFIRAITDCYGAEKGMELWEQITRVLDPEVKGQIFFAMLTGAYNDQIKLKGLTVGGQNNAVACIKEIRQWSGLGLKDAKDTYDRLRNHRDPFTAPTPQVITVKPEEHAKAMSGLRMVGFNI
jgi:hypothetical protein